MFRNTSTQGSRLLFSGALAGRPVAGMAAILVTTLAAGCGGGGGGHSSGSSASTATPTNTGAAKPSPSPTPAASPTPAPSSSPSSGGSSSTGGSGGGGGVTQLVDAALSTLSATPLGPIIADGTSAVNVLVTALDSSGNPISGKTVQVAVSGLSNTITQAAATTNSLGQATASFVTTKAGAKIITATVDGVDLIASQAMQFLGDPSTLSNTLSGIDGSATANLPADGTSTSGITVTARDANGNPIVGATVTLSATGIGNVLSQPLSVTGADGAAVGSLAATGIGVHVVSASINAGHGAVSLTPTVSITFDASAIPSTIQSTIQSLNLGTIIADGIAALPVKVTVKDASGNPLAGQVVKIASTGLQNTITQPSLTDATGSATGTIQSLVAEAKTISATVQTTGGPVTLVATANATFGNRLVYAIDNATDLAQSKLDYASSLVSSLQIPSVLAGSNPAGLVMHPLGKMIFAANKATSLVNGTVSMLPIQNTGELGTQTLTTVGHTPGWLTMNAAGTALYVSNDGDGTVQRFVVDPATGALSAAKTVTKDTLSRAAQRLFLHPEGWVGLNVRMGANATIEGYTIDAQGNWTGPTTTSLGGLNATAAAMDPSGKFLWVAGDTNDLIPVGQIKTFAVDQTTGALTATGKASALLAPTAMAVSQATGHLYALGANGLITTVQHFAVNTVNGTLNQVETAAAAGTSSLAMDPTGKLLMATGAGLLSSSQVFPINVDGSLGTAKVSTGLGSVAVMTP